MNVTNFYFKISNSDQEGTTDRGALTELYDVITRNDYARLELRPINQNPGSQCQLEFR